MDIKTILGDQYKEGMTSDEIVAALEGVDLASNEGEVARLKRALDKSNSEAASFKKQLRERMTEEESAKAAAAEEHEKLLAAFKELQRKNDISERKAQYIALGYEAVLAEETATAMADGDLATVMDNHQKHLVAFEKRIRAEALQNTPRPAEDGDSSTMTREKFSKLTPQKRYEFSQQHPDVYKQIYENRGEK